MHLPEVWLFRRSGRALCRSSLLTSAAAHSRFQREGRRQRTGLGRRRLSSSTSFVSFSGEARQSAPVGSPGNAQVFSAPRLPPGKGNQTLACVRRHELVKHAPGAWVSCGRGA